MRSHSLARLLVARFAVAVVAGLAPAALAQPAGAPPTSHASAAPHAPVTAVESIGITVGDLDRAVDFYTRVLGFEKASEHEFAGEAIEHLTGVFPARVRTARLRLGQESIELTDYLAPEGRPIPDDSRSNDRWFQHIAIVVSDMPRAYAHLRAHAVRHASSGPQTLPDWNPNAGGISAFYFKDPEGHVLEVIHFPPGKGDPRWAARAAESPTSLFLGIDHTAIVVEDTERSLAFYRDALGMRVAGGSENYGPEQERLNAVFGARLRITTLRAPQGPGVELLEYLAPTDGREYPGDARLNDLLTWTTNVTCPDTHALSSHLRGGARWISPGPVSGLPHEMKLDAAAHARDPDGHALRFAAPAK
ncbi:MAG: VOC family protein [Planctomycetota bacterium]|nr:VOC family protein [Planctomycetota bacterium]